MAQSISSVSPKGHVMLPAEIRRRLGLRSKDRVVVTLEGDRVVIVPLRANVDASYQAVLALA